MTGRTTSLAPALQQDLPGIAFQQEGVGDDEAVEHLDDVAVEKDVLGAPDPRVRPMAKRLVVGDFVLGERRLYRRRGTAEEAHHRPAGPEHPDDLTGQRLRG